MTTETKPKELLSSQNPMRQDSPKIMIVDDDAELLEELKKMLTLGGYQVEAVQSGYVAIDEAQLIKPDLILLDLKMTPKSGFQVAVELRASNAFKNIPIVAMTGFFTEKEHLLMMKLCGIKTYILKPFKPVNLIGKIEFALGRREEEY